MYLQIGNPHSGKATRYIGPYIVFSCIPVVLSVDFVCLFESCVGLSRAHLQEREIFRNKLDDAQ